MFHYQGKKMNIEIKQDVFDITKRLKEIDESYFVVFNLNRNKFELHSSQQHPSSYCLTFPFNTLDERAITLANKTRKENKDKLIKEMEEENQRLLKTMEKQALKEIL
jgi:hypothetical protein